MVYDTDGHLNVRESGFQKFNGVPEMNDPSTKGPWFKSSNSLTAEFVPFIFRKNS